MIQYETIKGDFEKIADQLCRLYNNEKIEIINVMTSSIHEDVFSDTPVHHIAVFYREKTGL